ncbi:CTP synthetase [Phaeobacter sp. HF9A]
MAGSAVIAALAMGYGSLAAILIAAAAGFVVAFPVSLAVARRLYSA